VLARFKVCIVPDQPTCPASLLSPLHRENYRKMRKDKRRKKGWGLDAGGKGKERRK